MSKVIHISKGLTIPLKGEAERIIHEFVMPDSVAVKPTDFIGLTPKIIVNEGDEVKAGDPLFADKNNLEIVLTAPISGKVSAIVRGEKRKLLEVVVTAEQTINYKKFATENYDNFTREAIVKLLVESGLWPYFKQRPYNCIPNTAIAPKEIYISTFDTAPLAPDYSFALAEYKSEFEIGISVIRKLTSGKVHLSVLEEHRTLHPFEGIEGVDYHYFNGIHPTGNVGIQIHHINPINKGEVVWTIQPQDVVILGRLFKNGIYDARKVVAVTGDIHLPKYTKTISGASFKSCINEEKVPQNSRIISGNVLTGTQISEKGYLGFYDSHISIIPEGNQSELLGWLFPGFEKFSLSRSFFSWLKPGKKYTLHTNTNGGLRAFVFTGVYEKVLPMNIYPMALLKAIVVNDIEKMEQLGIYEVVEEDFALCEYVCPSKIEIQSIIREGLDSIKKEFS